MRRAREQYRQKKSTALRDSEAESNLQRSDFDDDVGEEDVDYSDDYEPQVFKNSQDYLYQGCRYSRYDFCMSLMMLARSSDMSDRTVNKLLHLFTLMLPISNRCPTDIRTMKSILEDKQKSYEHAEKVSYCNVCFNEENSCNCGSRQILRQAFLQQFNVSAQLQLICDSKSKNICQCVL